MCLFIVKVSIKKFLSITLIAEGLNIAKVNNRFDNYVSESATHMTMLFLIHDATQRVQVTTRLGKQGNHGTQLLVLGLF